MKTELAPHLGRTLRWRGTVDRISTKRNHSGAPESKAIMLRNVMALDYDIALPHLWVTAPGAILWPGDHIEFNAVVVEYRRGYHLDCGNAAEIDYGLSTPTQISILEV